MKLISIPAGTLKKHQLKVFSVVLGTLVILGALLFFIGMEREPVPLDTMNEKAPLYDVTEALEDKSFWVFKSENRLAEQEKTQAKLMHDLEEIRESLKKPETENANSEIETLQSRVFELEQKLNLSSFGESASQQDEVNNTNIAFETPAPSYTFSNNTSQNINPDVKEAPLHPTIFSETIIMPNPNEANPKHHHDNYIPAGAYVKAVLLSGVDVSVGISSQSNPQPVLLRLVHPGSLPNKFLGKMRDCRIIAAASGELSTERAQFRLEKLSCIQPDGRVIETDVDGYISGEDGKNGMRGRMVMRDAEVLKRGFLGGLLSGLGKATSQSFNTTSVSPLGAVNTVKGGDIFKQAGAEGAGNAFELMAKYNIQRAEQYQPVIQISAGREVFVIFHSGRAFGEHRAKAINPVPHPKPHSLFGDNP
jgi:conjugal transfer pilus assembly protein TraB